MSRSGSNLFGLHFAVVLLLALVVRGGGAIVMQSSLTADPDAYRELARGIRLHGTFGLQRVDSVNGETFGSHTAFRPPLYPWLLSFLTDDFGDIANGRVAAFHFLVGIATVMLTYVVTMVMLPIARDKIGFTQVSDPRIASCAAALLVAIDPLLLQSASMVMTETVATFLVVVTLIGWAAVVDAMDRSSTRRIIWLSIALGVTCGLNYLCRPTFVLWPVMLVAILGGMSWRGKTSRPLIPAAVVICVMVVFVGGWTARNMRAVGAPIWATTHGGYTLLLGNNPSFYNYLRDGDRFTTAWDATSFIDRWNHRWEGDPRTAAFWESGERANANPSGPLSEVDEDRMAGQAATAAILREPGTFTLACAWRLLRLHSPHPLQTTIQRSPVIHLVTAYYVGVGMAVVLGIMSLGRRCFWPRWRGGFSLWASIAAVHLFYWTDMRMRTPLVPFFAVLVAVWVAEAGRRWQIRRVRSTTERVNR